MTGSAASRLAKLERVVSEARDGGRCQMCQGEPCCVFLVVHELSPDRKRFIIGDIYLAEESIGKFTEDVHDPRCLGCGAKARRAHVMYTPGIGPERKGKKLAA